MGGRRIEIRGTVQGVGFRPWVYRLARELGVGGRVRNGPGGVTIEAFGGADRLDGFVDRLRGSAPRPARVRELHQVEIPDDGSSEFVIVASDAAGARVLSIPPDLATCPACEAEVLDPADRRHLYPFTNCTHCGPRFTISTDVPYDRPATTMAPFEMCDDCQREYDSVADRRFHAQPNACPICGPRLWLVDPHTGRSLADDPLSAAAMRLLDGEIVAVKGLGGFHLACDAGRSAVVSVLRERKRRDQKPFAVMVRDLVAARALAELSGVEEQLLTAPERPIVLARRRPGAPLAREVAPDTDLVGLMLPYTPLHHLLLEAVGWPLVMTSGNLTDEPICRTNQDAAIRLADIADALLIHDREIANRCDDSVAVVMAGAPTVLRRSRGFVPRPVQLSQPVAAPVLALGGQLKNTFCLASRDLAYLGPHIGDLETVDAVDYLAESVERMCRLLEIRPEVVAHDMHPDYPSTRMARARGEATKVAVQHHHAHVVSAMAEHQLVGPVVGVAYDGTGWGLDGSSWGGEILLADAGSFQRLASFRPIRLAGGDAAIREVWRIAVALLDDAFAGEPPAAAIDSFKGVDHRSLTVIRQMISSGLNSPPARGVGRYFDGVGALALRRTQAAFEGQVAVAWYRAAVCANQPYPYTIGRGAAPLEIDLRPMVRALVGDLLDGRPIAELSARFHGTLVAVTAELIAEVPRLPVVLSGGVFANAHLAEGLVRALPERRVYLHREVPPGDGGLALGQAVVADAIARRSS